jgi:hypothetical protein
LKKWIEVDPNSEKKRPPASINEGGPERGGANDQVTVAIYSHKDKMARQQRRKNIEAGEAMARLERRRSQFKEEEQ